MAGLKHFDDMQQRITRAEVEQVHGIVFKAVSELLKVEGKPDADRLHCRVTGSYIRGKPMTGMNPTQLACQCTHQRLSTSNRHFHLVLLTQSVRTAPVNPCCVRHMPHGMRWRCSMTTSKNCIAAGFCHPHTLLL